MDSSRPSLAIAIESIKKSFVDAKARGVELRYLTEITNDNISYCKELMTILNELRHLDAVKGNFMLYEPRNVVLEADKGRTTQVISNLLSNAIKFTKKGTITIATKIDEGNNQIIINVKDTGTGIDPEILPELFSKFTTKSFSGTGLGLFISKSIVEAHGGKIWAENNIDGKGTTFTFILPYNLDAAV